MSLGHSRNRQGQEHLLADHLKAAAKLAQKLPSALDAGEPRYHAGLWQGGGEWNRTSESTPERTPGGAKLALIPIRGREQEGSAPGKDPRSVSR